MSRHHYETNPHFVRLPSQDQHLGGASSSRTTSHDKKRSPIIPEPHPHTSHDKKRSPIIPEPHPHTSQPRHDHQTPRSQPHAPPGILIKTRGRQRQEHPTEPIGHPIHESHSAIPLPLSPEDRLPPRTPNSARPLLLSPDQEQRPPQRGVYGATLPPIPKPTPWRTAPTPSPHHPGRGQHRPGRGQRPQPARETNAMTWSAAVCCAIFWIILILGGLIVLIVYLIYRPRSPSIDISAANLNAAYLDMGFLLNGDLTILANFTNPSKKSSVDFSYVTFELYYYNTLIATQYIEPFKVPKKMSRLADVHLVSSQVQLQPTQSRELQRQIETGPVLLNLRGTFHARSNLGALFRYSYWLHTHCSFSLNSPPSGTMRARRCNTKR